jgi:hypothetical protein
MIAMTVAIVLDSGHGHKSAVASMNLEGMADYLTAAIWSFYMFNVHTYHLNNGEGIVLHLLLRG